MKLRHVVFVLHRSIWNIKRNLLPEHYKQILILQGEVEVPENLRKVLHHLIYRPNKIQAEDHRKPKQERK